MSAIGQAPAAEPTFAGPLPAEAVTAQQQWERKLRADIEATLQEAMRTLRFALESRLQQELNAGLANALHDASPAVQQALVRRVGSWSAQLPPPSTDPWAAWVTALLDASEPARILQALFSAASALAPRLAIYVVRGSAAIAWRSAGLEAPARIDLDSQEHLFARVIRTGQPAHWRPGAAPWAGGAIGSLGGGVYPLSVRGKTIALLCYQSPGDAGVETRLGALTRVASVSLEQAMNSGGASFAGAVAIHSAPGTGPHPVAEPAETDHWAAEHAAAPAAVEEEVVPAPVPLAPMPVIDTSYPTGDADHSSAEEAESIAPPSPEGGGEIFQVSAFPSPEPAAGAVPPASGLAESDAAPMARARRFAKVLAQDLELYLQRDRPEVLAAARAQHDLYGQLREDLDKCRQSFLERYPAGSGPGLELLDAQLVAILAQGDASALGPAYPLAS